MTLPYMVHIAPSDIPSASSGTWTLAVASGALGGMSLTCATTQNSYIEWPILVAAGTYRLTMVHGVGAAYGIYTVSSDGATIGTVDGYAAGTADDTVTQVSSLAFTAGRHLLRFTMATKHASSTNYTALLQAVGLLRTGA